MELRVAGNNLVKYPSGNFFKQSASLKLFDATPDPPAAPARARR